MTELEQQLLSAFEQLQSEHEKQHSEFAEAYESLVCMFESTKQENAELRQAVNGLSELVEHLGKGLDDLNSKIERSRR